MRIKHNFKMGDRVVWMGAKTGAVVGVIDSGTIVVLWDNGERTPAPAWSRKLRHVVMNWEDDTVTEVEQVFNI